MYTVLDGEATDAEARELDRVLAAEPAARTEFGQIRRLFEGINRVPKAFPPEGLVAAVMAIGAVFGALNTMYSAVSERGREIATMRALGFGALAVVFSFLIEAVLISFVGGALGCAAVLPLNGFTTGAMNWQTFSHLAFAFKVTPDLLGGGILFALGMGVAGGLLPALHAALRPVAAALRSL